MLSSKTLNQNVLFFLKKKRFAKLWGAPQSYPHQLYSCTATKRSNFVAHKKSILISKIWNDFSTTSLCDIDPSL